MIDKFVCDFVKEAPRAKTIKEIDMNKETFYVVGSQDIPAYETYEAAEEKAKRSVARTNTAGYMCSNGSYLILKSVALVKAPVPEAVVTKFA